MELAMIPGSQMRRRLNTIPLPKQLKSELSAKFLGWVQTNGPVWAVSRLKDFKAFILQVKAGESPKVVKPSWFQTTPYGNLTGIYGDLLQRSLSSESQFRAVVTLINVYSSVRYKVVPETEVRKAVEEITQPQVAMPHWIEDHFALSPFRTAARRLQKWQTSVDLKALHHTRGGKGPIKLRRPIPLAVVPASGRQAANFAKDLFDVQSSELVCFPEIKDLIDAALGAYLRTDYPPELTHRSVGDIWFKGEPGLKVRYFASPNTILQRVLDPLKDELLRLARTLPWDCTHDQTKADASVSACLARGKTVYSVDLKKATENFPWVPQRLLLRRLMLGTYNHGQFKGGKNAEKRKAILQLLDGKDPYEIVVALPRLLGRSLNREEATYFVMRHLVEKGCWRVNGSSEDQISWSKGQPLGTGPSFPLFTMTHGMLLWFLNHGTWGGEFFVLGDDVVITDASLHRRYIKTLQRIGVAISPTKSYQSNHLAQFAGKTFTRGGQFYSSPWHEIRAENELDLAAYWYPGLIKGKSGELVDWVLSLPQPWGIGRNPGGLSLDARLPARLVEGLLADDGLVKPIPATGLQSTIKLMAALKRDDEKLAVLRWFQKPYPWTPDPARVRLPYPLVQLMEGTDIPGAPKLAKARVNPWTLGRVGKWKRLMKIAFNPDSVDPKQSP